MVIYRPEAKLSKRDKRLLQLIAQLLLQYSESGLFGANLPKGMVPLSDSEAEELDDLLDAFISNRRFLEASYFVEEITAKDDRNESALKEIYHSGRKRRGRSRAMGSTHWSEFLTRLSVSRKFAREILPDEKIHPDEMSFRYFLEMEERLFSSLGVDPRMANFILLLIEMHEHEITRLRHGATTLPHGTFKKIVSNLTTTIRSKNTKSVYDHLTSKIHLCSVATFVANTSVMFTTRDWGVTGTVSCMAGAFIGMHKQG